MKTKRKPVVAWAVVDAHGYGSPSLWGTKEGALAWVRETGEGRVVKLVEHDPRKEAVVRAALKWLTDFEPLSDNRLVNAVERYRGRR